MKFAHLADTHLGYRQYGLFEREKDFYEVFEKVIDKIKLITFFFAFLQLVISTLILHGVQKFYLPLTLLELHHTNLTI